jgi:hypothetical protein
VKAPGVDELLETLDELFKLLMTLDLEDEVIEDLADDILIELTELIFEELLATTEDPDESDTEDTDIVDESAFEESEIEESEFDDRDVSDETVVAEDTPIDEEEFPDPTGSGVFDPRLPPPPQADTTATNPAVPKDFNSVLKTFMIWLPFD